MGSTGRHRRQRRKKVVKRNDGSLYDVTEKREISEADLREFVRGGGFFEARRADTGDDCTYELLQSMIGSGLRDAFLPYGGLSGLADLGSGANVFGGLPVRHDAIGLLGQLARSLGDEPRESVARNDASRTGCAEPDDELKG